MGLVTLSLGVAKCSVKTDAGAHREIFSGLKEHHDALAALPKGPTAVAASPSTHWRPPGADGRGISVRTRCSLASRRKLSPHVWPREGASLSHSALSQCDDHDGSEQRGRAGLGQAGARLAYSRAATANLHCSQHVLTQAPSASITRFSFNPNLRHALCHRNSAQ